MAYRFNPDNLDELPLSDYEKGYLTAFYEGYLEIEEYKCQSGIWYEHLLDEDQEWARVKVGDREFDLCMYFDLQKIEKRFDPDPHYTEDLIVLVYECYPDIDGMGIATGQYSTDTSLEYFLKEAS